MKLNRKWLLAIALVLSLTMAISGTLAYLTDRDTVENVFTMGNVDIEVVENFTDNSSLYPGVSVTKEAGIKNTHATEPAYVWMVVSVPANLAGYIELDWADSYSADDVTTVTSPHAGYNGYLVKYPSILEHGESTGNILEKVKLAANVDYQGDQYVVIANGQTVAELGDLSNVSIMVDGFAIQIVGITDMNDNNGVDVNDAYLTYIGQWNGLNGGESGTGSEGGEPGVTYTEVSTAVGLREALANGGNIKLMADITATDLVDVSGSNYDHGFVVFEDTTIDLNGHTISLH